MSRQDSFDRIVQSLHAAAFGDARWPAASALIDESIGANGTFLVIADGATQNDVLFAQLCSRGERHRDLEREYYGVYYPIDERLPRIRTLPDGRLDAGPLALDRRGEEDLGGLQRAVAAHAHSGRPRRVPGRTRRFAHRLVDRRSRRPRRLDVGAGRDDRAASAASAPVHAGAPGAGRRRGARRVAGRIARQRPGGRHPARPPRPA